ncbi:unnamed protein product [Nesidiocoris tenuis]|uniref:EGF-like domain-containing protein n=1 Tax=Nesidiocoris tenuis TaxID=355587 RepID=A0A6H5GBM5_9HEMI|nr:unnamed protein product [Nesidiocoris tenuis]
MFLVVPEPPIGDFDSTDELFAGTMCIDMRQESCFTEFKHGQGQGILEGLYPRTLCCCSGIGKAWGGPSGGERCELCPKSGTNQFNELCPKILTNANVCRASAKEASVVTHRAASAVTAPRATNCQQTNDTAKGSYGCRCKDGFVGDGVTCRDINECLTNNGGCNQHAQCRNTQGSYECVCDAGFRGDGVTCTDIDECAEHPMYCQNGHCLNQPGNYRCECEMGFMHPDSTETACVGKQLKTIFHDKS